MTELESSSADFPLEPLTWREEDILNLLSERQTDREIAQALNISYETVKWYNKRLYAKLGVRNRREAAARFEELGLLGTGSKEPTDVAHNLPSQSTPFVGRQQELDELSNLLGQVDVRLVTVLGPGGMGKTRLALKLAEQQFSRFVDGVFFVPLSTLGSENHLASAVAEAAGLRLQVGANPKKQMLQFLRNKQFLLLLDNFEYALSSAGLIGEILDAAPGIKILATSRERLHLSSETIYPISGLDMPSTKIIGDDLAQHDAIGLFIQSAQHIDPSFEAGANDFGPIADICRLVDGMPLGIVLAASWVRLLSPGEIANEINTDLDFLSTELRDAPKRHHSIRAVFASTWRRLSSTARNTFENLSVCRDGFTLEAARKIASTNLPTLQLLADRGLLRRTRAGRYEIHELLRQFALERLQQRDTFRDAYNAHCMYYADLLYNLETEFRSKRQSAALSKIEDDIENVETAWRFAFERGNDAAIARMLTGLYYFYEARGWSDEGEATFKTAVKRFASDIRTGERTLLYGRLLARQGAFAHRLGHYQQAVEALQTSLSILRTTSARGELAFTLSFIADLARSFGKYELSRKLCRESLSLFKEVDDSWGMAGELHNLGVAAYHLENFGEARDYYIKSLQWSRELNDQHGIVTSLIGLGVLAHDLGDFQQAVTLYSESLAMSEDLDDRYGVAASLINLGRVYYLIDDLEEGKIRCQLALDISRDLGDPWGTAASMINLGDITCAMENYQESRAHFKDALQIVTELHSEPLEVEILVGMATLLAETGNEESALELLSPILRHPPDDKEIRERVNKLLDKLASSLVQATVIEIQTRNSDKSIEAAVRQLFH